MRLDGKRSHPAHCAAVASGKEVARLANEFRCPDDGLDLLLGVMPPHIREAFEIHPQREALIEIILDLGRPPEARTPGKMTVLAPAPVERADIEQSASGSRTIARRHCCGSQTATGGHGDRSDLSGRSRGARHRGYSARRDRTRALTPASGPARRRQNNDPARGRRVADD